MKNILVLVCIFIGFFAFGQNKPKNVKIKTFEIASDTIYVDSVSISPDYFKVYTSSNEIIEADKYHVNFEKSMLVFEKKFIRGNTEIIVEYQPLPEFLTKSYFLFDENLIVPKATSEATLYRYQDKNSKKNFKPFDGLFTSGSLSRGVTVGNNQDAVVNSNFNLQIEGKLSENVGIRASITDNEIPLQEGGYTQRLDEFDKVYMEIYSKNWSVKAGDIDLANIESSFMRFQKKISGILVNAKLNHDNGQTDMFASGALVRGRYNNFEFQGLDGNQGPYKIIGNNNEQYVIIVSGSERIYANGILLKRGENGDYIVDYNTGEITFTTIYPVTSNLRFKIEYQIADRNYTRFLTYDGVQYESDKLHIGVQYYSEKDSKNKTVQQDLTNDQKQILADAGDDKTKMVAPSAVPATFIENRILYEKITQNNVEYFVYSTDRDVELFQVSFTYVGENKGDYKLQTTLATGRVYEYISEINGVKQGGYLPVIQLIAPESLQMLNVDAKYNPSDKTNFSSEFTFSEKDQNLYSDLEDGNNTGFASKINWQQVILDKKWKLTSELDAEYIDKNFQTIERFRSIEFSRDWNIVNNFNQIKQEQQFISAKLNYQNDSLGRINYAYENLQLGSNYKGNRHGLEADFLLNKTKINAFGNVLHNEDEIEKNVFYRWYSTVIQSFSKNWIGAKLNYENNQGNEINTSIINPLSHKFTEVEGFYGIGDSTKVFLELGYNYRVTDSVQNAQLQKVSTSNTYFMKSKLVQNKNTDLGVFLNYRTVDNQFTEDEKSLNSRISYGQKIFDSFMTFQTLYETQTGNLPQQEFTYIEVEPGKGFYEWIDFNSNGVQELDEFVIAQFQDQAIFVRVLLPNLTFIKTNQNKLSQTFNLNPARWKKESGIKKALSHFYNQAYFLMDTKTEREGETLVLYPFSFDDDNLIALDLNLKNSLFFNRGLQNYSMVYSYLNSRKKTVFVFGDQDIQVVSHQFQFLHKLGSFWLFDFNSGLSENESTSQSFANRNYMIDNFNIHPKISYLYEQNSRLDFFYNYKNKENQINEKETLKMHIIGVNFQFAKKQNFSINANANLYLNSFDGNINSPVAFQMLEGLQPGTNFTWLLTVQKRLTSYLDLNLNYFGRKSEDSKTIHTGTMQLRASF